MSSGSKVIFGWELDGMIFPATSCQTGFSLGEYVIGPSGLLELLELRLGSGYPRVSNAVRTAQYFSRISTIDDGYRFFSASMSSDPWATASYLLRQRDRLVEAGWVPSVQDFAHERLRVFSLLEEVESPSLAPGLSDRIAELLRLLGDRNHLVKFDKFCSITPLQLLPCSWRRLLAVLEDQGNSLSTFAQFPNCQSGDLALLQRAVDAGQSSTVCTGDGSILILESGDEIQAAEFLSTWLISGEELNAELAIIRGIGASLLDESCRRVGLPRIGGERRSRFRGAMQVLPLALENLWAPTNPNRLMELLCLPQSPVPASAAYWFAEALKEEPGQNGKAWKQAWLNILQKRWETLIEQGVKEGQLEETLEKEVAEWKEWLEPACFDAVAGTDCRNVISVCRRVEKWALQKLAVLNDSLYNSAAEHAASVAQALSEAHLQTINKVQLEHIVDDAFEDGLAIPSGYAEAASWAVVDSPGQIWGPVNTLVWWGFIGGEERGEKHFWSQTEACALESCGIRMDPVGLAKLREENDCRQALLNARNQVVFVKPLSMKGKASHAHPFWPQVQTWLEKNCTSALKKQMVYKASVPFSSVKEDVGGRQLNVEPIGLNLLPAPRRLWIMPPEYIKHPEKTSYTSMSSLLSCPFAWALEHPARIRTGYLLDIPEDERLVGNMAHSLVASLFEERAVWQHKEAADRAIELFDDLLPAVALPLLCPDKTLQLKRFREGIRRAISRLVLLLNQAELQVAGCEVEKTQPFEGGIFAGAIDLLCRSAEDSYIVLDLKWTRSAIYRQREIQQDKALQLAVYNWFLTEENMRTAGAGYYMLRQARLLFTDSEPFPPDAYVAGSNLKNLWQAAYDSYKIQFERIRRGIMTAAGVGEASEEERHSVPPVQFEAPCRFCAFGNICGKRFEGT